MITDKINIQLIEAVQSSSAVYEDFKRSVVIVSLLANLALFVTWLVVTV